MSVETDTKKILANIDVDAVQGGSSYMSLTTDLSTQIATIDTVVDGIDTVVDGIAATLLTAYPSVATKALAVTGTGATVLDIFTVTGCVEITSIVGRFTAATDTTTCSGAGLIMNDGTNDVDITESTTGTNLSGAIVGDVVYKSAVAGTAITEVIGDQNRLIVGTMQYPFGINCKGVLPTTIQFSFTGDAATDAVITWYIVYISYGGTVVAA